MHLNIDVRNMQALVAGGGAVATRKIKSLIEAGALVRVVAPELTSDINQLADLGKIILKIRCYQPRDLNNIFLAVAATNDPETNHRIAVDARQRGLLVTVTDKPDLGNCTFPALLRRGDMEIGVSTNGSCPGFATVVRDYLATVIGEEYGTILTSLAAEREKLLTEGHDSNYNTKILRFRARELINEFTQNKDLVP